MRRKSMVILLCVCLAASVFMNALLLLKLRSLWVGNAAVEFYGAVGGHKALAVIGEPLMVNLFGKDWRTQRIFEKTSTSAGKIYESNYLPIPEGTFPILVSAPSSVSHFQLYSLTKKICCDLQINFRRKAVEWHTFGKQETPYETLLPNGELRLKWGRTLN